MTERTRTIISVIGTIILAALSWARALADDAVRVDWILAVVWTLVSAGVLLDLLPVKLPRIPARISGWIDRAIVAALLAGTVGYILHLTWMGGWFGLALLGSILILLGTFIYGLNGHHAIKAWFVSLTRKT